MGLLNSVCAHTLHETQQSIHQLDHKIETLQQHLSLTQKQQLELKQALLRTEQSIKQHQAELANIQQSLLAKKNDITVLEQKIETLNQHYRTLQSQLEKQIQARYKHPGNQPLAWLLISAEKNHMDKLLTYYHYLIRANQNTMTQLKDTQATLVQQQKTLRNDLNTLNTLQEQWNIQQQHLINAQAQRKKLLSTLGQTIQTQQNTLSTYQQNRDNLTQILRTLNQQSIIQTRLPMTRMKRKLPKPVHVTAEQIQKHNQGIVLYSAEGSPVYSVYPGKIVFCDWLNGYGLLMIVDHGWGLMTLYANNLAFTKQKGDTVTQGEQIAKVGHSGNLKQPGLYFEIRRYGKATPPLEWLEN